MRLAKLALPLIIATALSAWTLGAAAAVLRPLIAGNFSDGDGVNSRFTQVVPDWRGTTFGHEPWGTGPWSVKDATDVLGLPASDPSVVDTFRGVVPQIAFANERYNEAWADRWGPRQLAPLFQPGDPNQENWVGLFSGYIAIPSLGEYNLSVLIDDGFQLDLIGAGDELISIDLNGLNPRTRVGLDEPLSMQSGLYGFRLISYNRLEAGVIDLAWFLPGGDDWEIIPTNNLFTRVPPRTASSASTLALAALGLLVLASLRHLARRAALT